MPKTILAALIAALVLALPAGASGSDRDEHPMYLTPRRSPVQLRLLTNPKRTTATITFSARCAGGDLVGRFRNGRITTRQTEGKFAVQLTAAVNAKTFTGTVTTSGPGCRATQAFTARLVG